MSNSRCAELGVPSHLHSAGRPIDESISPDEIMYHRIPPSAVSGTVAMPEAFKTTRTSVVRKLLTHGPQDCLYDGQNGRHCLDFGVAELSVLGIESLTKMHPQEKDTVYTFRVKHVPLECLYPHCEIWTFKNGSAVEEIKPASVKTWLRGRLSELARIAVTPRVP